MPNDDVACSERAGQSRLGRTENGNDRHAEQRGEMHRPGVVSQEQARIRAIRRSSSSMVVLPMRLVHFSPSAVRDRLA